jgi:hypothetical protein
LVYQKTKEQKSVVSEKRLSSRVKLKERKSFGTNKALYDYVVQRKINPSVASQLLNEVYYEIE